MFDNYSEGNMAPGKCLAPGFQPVSLNYIPGNFAEVNFSNGQSLSSTCIRCPDMPCTVFNSDELVSVNLINFPSDRSNMVCPSNAIELRRSSNVPLINSELCIMCGVCASRCPVGAIALIPGVGAQVNDVINMAFIETEHASMQMHALNIALFGKAARQGVLLIESDAILDDVFERFQGAWNRIGERFPNLLTRSLMIGAQVGAVMTRKGITSMRMDFILGPPGIGYGVAEVEFGQEAILDGPRDVMDAIAVLVSRYKWSRDNIGAFVITDVLPNKRSEYWSIIEDFNNVFKIKIGTITIFALMLANWNRVGLGLETSNKFYAPRGLNSYREEILESFLGRKLEIGSQLRPQVDMSK